jgi:signal transduction histidine kinase
MEDAADAEQVRAWAGEIEAGAERLVTTMAMSGTQSWRAVEEPYLLDEALQGWVLELVRKRSEAVSVRFELGCGGVRLTWFSGAVRRVVNHLVHNALDAMLGEVGEKRPLLTIRSCQRNGDWVEVQVGDNGPGVAEAVRQTVLQEPHSTKGGSRRGYGLLFARSLVENMDGKLRLLPSELGAGAIFSLTIPIC